MTTAKVRLPHSESIARQLTYLYSRRLAVENLIQSLESYAVWVAKPAASEDQNALDIVRERVVSHRAGVIQANDARAVNQYQRRSGATSVP